MKLLDILSGINPILRILCIVVLSVAAHFAVKAIRRISQKMLTMKVDRKAISEENMARRYPKIATIITILVSAVTFSIYFVAVGMILREFKISLTTYFASATVIGLAVGFGLQGFVQDLVIGLTLIFSDALNIGEVVKLGDEIGRVDNIGLRFTTLINLHGQRILIPNRNIAVISQFRGGCIRAYVDIQLPQEVDEKEISRRRSRHCQGHVSPAQIHHSGCTGNLRDQGMSRMAMALSAHQVQAVAGTNENRRRDIQRKSGPGIQKIRYRLRSLDDYRELQS
jgi:small-conductance mechanosensitive channel